MSKFVIRHIFLGKLKLLQFQQEHYQPATDIVTALEEKYSRNIVFKKDVVGILQTKKFVIEDNDDDSEEKGK